MVTTPVRTRPRTILVVALGAAALLLAGLALVDPTAAQSEPAPTTTAPTTTATSGEAAAQTAPASGAGLRVAFVGDSIGHSAEPHVRQALGDDYRLDSYDSVDGSTIADHRTAVARLLQSASRPEILVIELGTNDAEQHGSRRFDRDLRAMLDLVSPRVAEVRWFDQKDTPTGYYRGVDRHAAMFNRSLRVVASRYPNVSVVPYADWTRSAPPGSFLADRLHLTARGRHAFARITRNAVDQAAAELVAS
jgi:lysophospholipase L1-like esterase